MTRQNRHGDGSLRVFLAVLLTGAAAAGVLALVPQARAQAGRPPAGQTEPPATQPSGEEEEGIAKLMRLKAEQMEKRQAAEQQGADEAAPRAGAVRQPAGPRVGRGVTPPPPTQPADADAEPPADADVRLDELRRRGRTSTQGAVETPRAERPERRRPALAAEPADEDDDDFFGPSYPPATPADELAGRRRLPQERTAEVSARPERPGTAPVSTATDDLEWFNYEGMPWEDVIREFAERLGKPLLGDVLIGDTLTYVSDRKFTKEEAIDELNLIMHMIGYRFVETEHHIFVVPLSEMPVYVEVEQTYPSREAFEEADPRPMDYVTVYVQVKEHAAGTIQSMFETMVSDYMTIMALDESNQLKLVGLVKDIHKVLGLMDRIRVDESDPRITRIFQIETNAGDIERILREVLEIGAGSPLQRLQAARRPVRGRVARPTPVPVPEPAAASSSRILMTADERTNTIIVRAVPSKIEEIAELIKEIDKKPDLDFYTQVTQIQNANAVDVAELLNKILSQEQGQTPAWQVMRQMQLQRQQQQAGQRGARQRVQPQQAAAQQGATPEELLGEGLFERAKRTIRIAPDERTNTLIVYANKDGHERVAKLLVDIDRAQPSNLQTVVLENTEVGLIYPTLSQIVQSMATFSARGRNPSIVPDEDNNLFHVLAEREQMQQIQEVIQQLDVAMPATQRHVVELVNLVPSRVAQMVESLLASSASTPTAPAVRQRLRRGTAPTVGSAPTSKPNVQIIPLDEARLLIVVCSDDDWAKVEETIKLWDDRARFSTPSLHTFEIARGDAGEIANTLNAIYRGQYNHPSLGRSQVLVEAKGTSVMVYAVDPAIDEISPLIAALDRADSSSYEILPLAFVDVTQVADEALRLFSSAPTGRGRTAADTGLLIQAEPITNSLIVRGEAAVLERVKDYAMERDQAVGAQAPERKTYTLRYADPAQLVQAVNSFFGGGPRRRGQPVGSQVQAFASGMQLVVEGPKAKLPEIDQLVADLDQAPAAEDDIRTLDLQYADAREVKAMIDQMFSRVRGRGGVSSVQVNVSGDSLIIKAPPEPMEQIAALVAELDRQVDAGLAIRTYELKLLNAGQVAGQVQGYLRSVMPRQRRGQMQPGAFAEPTTNTLIVMAPEEHLPFVDGLIAELEQSDRGESEARVYLLARARADDVARNVDQMLKARVAEREGQFRGRTVQQMTAVFSDGATNRLFVYAPEEYQETAAQLIELLDAEMDNTDTVRIVTLERADAVQLAESVRQVILGNRLGSGTPGARSGTATVRVTADASSNSILLAGMPRDIAEVVEWIEELEGKSETTLDLQIFRLAYASAADVADTLAGIFGGGTTGGRRGPGSGPTGGVTITPDNYHNRLLVTANRRKMREVEAFIAQLDAAPERGDDLLTDPSGRQLYFVDIYRGDAFDIAWDVRDMLPSAERGGPTVESDWFGEYIKVRCRPSEFDQILALIRQFEQHAKVERKVIVRKLKGAADTTLEYLRKRTDGDDLLIEYATEDQRPDTMVETLWHEGEVPPWKQRQRERELRRREQREEARPTVGRSDSGVRPFRLGLPVTMVLLGDAEAALWQDDPAPLAAPRRAQPPVARPAEPSPPAADAPAALPPGVRRADMSTGAAEQDRPRTEREKTRIVVQPDGSIIIHGPKSDVNEVESILDLLEQDLDVGEVIRIFEFKYGDVSAAAEVLNIMFNERQVITLPQQQQQARQQRPRGREDDERGDQQDALERLLGRQPDRRDRQRSGQRVRIATDPGHNYLIIKCNQSDLPEIRQLLRELDIPPGEVELKVFQLRNLDASETAENIKEVLGISKAQSRRGRQATPARGQRGGGQAELMEMLQQQMISVPGVEGGAKVEQVEIVPNSVTNSLMVSAPPEVMKLIENVIGELEELEGYDVVGIYHYPLEYARVDDVLPLLQEIFGAAGGASGGRTARPAGRGGAHVPGLGTVTVSGDPRVNTIIFTAQAKDVDIVRAQIRMLDIEGAIAEAETYVCEFGEAAAIADVVQSIFGAGGGRAGARGGQTTGATQEVRIVAEPATNTIVVWGPPDKRELIFAKIRELDQRGRRDIREIDVFYTDAAKLADKLLQMFGGGTQRTGRGQAGAGTGTGNIIIMGDRDSKKLLVRAPDAVFLQIEEVVATLDQPSEQMLIRRYALAHADASVVVESVKGALTEYVQMAGGGRGGDLPFDAFTAVPDPRTNSIIVVGSQQTFAFVESVLATIDVETPAERRNDFRVFVLDKADAEAVAQAINDFASGVDSSAAGGRGPRGGQRPGAAGTGGLGRALQLHATADATTNTVMVFGQAEHIDLVEDQIIAQYEDAIRSQFDIATIPVVNVKPTEIVAYIWQFVGEPQAQTTGSRDRRGRGAAQTSAAGPQIVPNDNAGNLIVRGTARDIEHIRELVKRFDNPGMIQSTVTVVQVPLGQDVSRLASDLERIVNEAEDERSQATGGRPRRVSVAADEYTNSLIVGGDPVLFGMVQSLVNQLGDVRRDRVVTRVINLGNLSSQDAQQMIEDLQRRGGTGGTRTPGGTQRGTGGTRRSGRRGDAGWPGLREFADTPWQSAPRAWLSPYVSAMVLQPGLYAAIADEWLAVAADDPPQSGAPEPAEDEPVVRRRRPLRQAPPAPEPTDAPPIPETAPLPPVPGEPGEGLTGITGELRGNVVVGQIDSKRIMVTGDESDVAFIEQILLMMEQSASPAVIHVFPIQNAKATVLAPIIEQAVKAMIEVGTGSPGPADRFSISAEGRSNALIVAASERVMGQIAELIEQLDVARIDEGAVPRAIALRHIRAAEAVALLRPALEELYRIQEVPKDSQASISAIDRSNSLLVVGTPKDQADIEQLIKTIDVEVTAEDEQAGFVFADAVVIPLKNGQAEDVAKVLMDMIAEQQKRAREAKTARDRTGDLYVTKLRLRTADGRELPALDLERPIGIIPEKGTNSLIVFSTPANNESLTAIVHEFDTLPIGAETDLKAIALRYASAEDVADVLQKVFDDGKKALARPSEGDSRPTRGVLPPVPPTMTGKGLPYNLVVQHDARSNIVVLVGRSDAVLLAASLVAELDQPSVELAGQPHVLRLRNYQVTQLQEMLENFFNERAKALGVDKNRARDNAVIIADERANALVVLATEEVYNMVEDLALELDSAENYRIVDTRFHALAHADAQKLAALLQELFDRRRDAERDQAKEVKDVLHVIADTRSNSVALTGTRDYLAEAAALIENLDQPFDRTVVMQVRPIRLNTAANVATLLQDMVDKALKEQESKLEGSPIYIAAEPLSDSLLMAASREDMAMLERWVDILDRPSEVGRMTRILPLRRSSAEEVARAAQDIFSKAAGRDVDVSITHDATTNSVIAFGPAGILGDIAAFVHQLDVTDASGGAVIRIFKLDQADAEDAGDLLMSILEMRSGAVGGGTRGSGGRGGSELEKQVMLLLQHERGELGLETLRAMRSDIAVISDLRTNSLVVTAPADSMPLMESLIARIDVPPDAAKIRVFTLLNADAEQMVDMLEKLFERRAAGASRGGADESARELTLGAGGIGGRQEVSFTVDSRTNSVIAAGTPGYLDLVEELVLELDTRPIEDRKTTVYAPRNMVAENLASAIREYSQEEQKRLQELGDKISLARRQEREIVAISYEDSNRIILSYSPRIENQVLDIVRELDQSPPQVSIEVLIIEVSMSNSLELGVEFAFQDLQWTKAGTQDTTTFDFVGGTDVGAAGAGLGGFTFTITGRDFNFLLRTLQSESNLNVLSRPHIVATDNQPAKIEIFDDVPYVSGTSTSTAGQVTTSVGREEIGITLEVTPQINPDGFVRMEIMQEVSDLTDSTVPIAPGVSSPIFFRRRAETVVTVQDGETVVLGGLIQSRASKTEQKIPLVGDLPLLGPLFRYQNDEQRRSELLIIMTPRVVRTVEDYRELSVQARDHTGIIPDTVKTNPLMRGLRVDPEELVPSDGTELFGPFDETLPPEEGWMESGAERYGPMRPVRPLRRPERAPRWREDPDSYNVPLGMSGRQQWEDRVR
jgi:type II secretion system protein D